MFFLDRPIFGMKAFMQAKDMPLDPGGNFQSKLIFIIKGIDNAKRKVSIGLVYEVDFFVSQKLAEPIAGVKFTFPKGIYNGRKIKKSSRAYQYPGA